MAQVLGPLEYIRCQNRQFAEEFISEVHFKPSLIGLMANTLGDAGLDSCCNETLEKCGGNEISIFYWSAVDF